MSLKMNTLHLVYVSLALCAVTLCEIENSAETSYEVIVVGLGAAGISALSNLGRAGRKVLGLEASNRIGGRVNTVEFGRGIVELGAEWIQGDNGSVTFDLAEQNQVPIREYDLDYDIRISNGSRLDSDLRVNFMTFFMETIEHPTQGPESVEKYFTRKFLDHIKKISTENFPHLATDADFINAFLDFSNERVNIDKGSNDWQDLPSTSTYESLGDNFWVWHTIGYKTLFDILLNKYKNGTGLPVEIELHKEVTSIQWSKDPQQKVTLKCKDETTYTADTVIVTVSLGVLKERHDILFSPKLPDDKIYAINSLSMGIVDKIIFSYDSPWWPENSGSIDLMWKKEDKAKVPEEDAWTTKVAAISMPQGCENCITLWLSGEGAKMMETLPDYVVIKKCTEILHKFIGSHIPEPNEMIRSAWYSNPFFRGCDSYDNMNVTDTARARFLLGVPLLDDAGLPKLLFAGEATSPNHSKEVHGAVETGIREAEYLLKKLNISITTNRAILK